MPRKVLDQIVGAPTMALTSLPPFIWFFLGAALIPFTQGLWRNLLLLATPLVSGFLLWQMGPEAFWHMSVFGYELTPVRIDRLSLLFGYLFHIAALIGIVFALHVRDPVQQVASLLYAGSALGAVFAGDLIILFIFWELL